MIFCQVCRDMTCQCGYTELVWRPRQSDYDAARASNLSHQMPYKGTQSSVFAVPRSVRIQQEIRKRAMDPTKQ